MATRGNGLRRLLLALILPELVGGLGGVSGCRDHKQPLAPVPQSGALAPVVGNSALDGEIQAAQAGLRGEPPPADAVERWAKLARLFVRKARIANDPRYYQLADDAVERALKIDPEHNGALQVRQAVLLNAHRFVEAQRLATQQIKRQPRDPVAWGALGDSALELGDYDTAMHAYQVMIDVRPDLRSYNRGAWMRWLTGDVDGAVELMGMAIGASGTRESEPRAYCRVQLGDLYFNRGQYDKARAQYDLALRDQPGYAPASYARGRLLLDTGSTAEGLSELAASLSTLPSAQTRAAYIDALLASGRQSDAERETAVLLKEGAAEDGRQVSLFLSSHHQQPELALRLAQDEVQRRPDIFSQDALGWAAYRSGQLELAWEAVQKATRLGTPDPRLRFHLGAVALARGNRPLAVQELRQALTSSPHWDLNEPGEARALLVQAGETPP